jgi:biotin carboxyl carrier protein
MDKYRVTIGEHEYLIEIDGERVWIDGQPAYIGIHFLNENGLFMVEKDSGKREYHLKQQDDGSYRVTTRGLQVEAQIEPEKGRTRKRTGKEGKKDAGSIDAPIPGVVTNVQVAVGDNVEHNQVLVVLESMKMLMEFRAPFAGVVEKISVAKGQKVEKGDEMVRIKK